MGKIFLELTPEQIKQVCETESQKITKKPESYSISGAARELGISKSTMHRMINDGKINKTTCIGKSPRILRSEIEKFL